MKTKEQQNDTVKTIIRERYGRIAEEGGSCGGAPTCCTPGAVGASTLFSLPVPSVPPAAS